MKKQLFPKEFLSHSFEVHQFQHGKKSQRIYWVILLFLVAVLFSLPLMKVNVFSTVRGMIKPKEERFVLRANAGGQELYCYCCPKRILSLAMRRFRYFNVFGFYCVRIACVYCNVL